MEDRFEEYQYLGEATVKKYYKHYLQYWEEDIMQTAYLGVFKALKKVDMSRIDDPKKLNMYIVRGVRNEIMNWEANLFGSRGTVRREAIYNTTTINSPHGFGDGLEFIEGLREENEDILINNIDIKNAISKLNEEEKEIVRYIMEGRKMIELAREKNINKDKLQRQKKKTLEKLKILL